MANLCYIVERLIKVKFNAVLYSTIIKIPLNVGQMIELGARVVFQKSIPIQKIKDIKSDPNLLKQMNERGELLPNPNDYSNMLISL